MQVFYKGLYASQDSINGARIWNQKGFVLLQYPCSIKLDSYNLLCMINEYINHCGDACWQYYNYVNYMIDRQCLPPEEFDSTKVTSNRILYASNIYVDSDAKMSVYVFVAKRW